MTRLKILMMSAITIFSITACGTIEGAGRDIESVGDAIADEAAD